jgi:hypothetical protein
MVIRDGQTVTIKANLSPKTPLDTGRTITWSPANPGNVKEEVIARVVNSHDALLQASKAAKEWLELFMGQPMERLGAEGLILKTLRAAIAKAEGK